MGEKERRIHWQNLTYAAMRTLDKILGRTLGKNNTTEDTFEEDLETMEQEFFELNKYLKHARDDKEIRLGEIQELGEKIVELGNAIDHLQGQIDRLRKALTSKEA